MKKTFIVFIFFLFTFLITGCKKVDYKELWKNQEIEIVSAITEEEICDAITKAQNYLKNVNVLQVNIYGSNEFTEITRTLKYDKEQEILSYEYKQIYYDDSQYFEGSIYCIDGISYNYSKTKLAESKFKEKCDMQSIINHVLRGFSVEYIFREDVLSYGSYNYGKDNYKNTTVVFEQEKAIPKMFQCCGALVIDGEKPIFFCDYFYGTVDYYEYVYKGVKINIPELEGYEFMESE